MQAPCFLCPSSLTSGGALHRTGSLPSLPPWREEEFARREPPSTVGRAKRVGCGLPAARERGHGLPWVQTPPELVLSPGRRDLPPLLHWPGHRWHHHPEEHGAVQHGRHCHVSAGHRQVAGSSPRAPRPTAGEGGQGQLLRGKWARETQEIPSVGLSLSCHRGHQQSIGSEPMSIWLSQALEPHPLVPKYDFGPSPSLLFSKWVTRVSLVWAVPEGRGVWLAKLGPSPLANTPPLCLLFGGSS